MGELRLTGWWLGARVRSAEEAEELGDVALDRLHRCTRGSPPRRRGEQCDCAGQIVDLVAQLCDTLCRQRGHRIRIAHCPFPVSLAT
jgi:hypothetical protein